MDRESMEALRYDRRLTQRRGWIATDELEQVAGALPDAAAKAITLGDAADRADGKSAAPEPSAAPHTPEP